MPRNPKLRVVDGTLFVKSRFSEASVRLDTVEYFLLLTTYVVTDVASAIKADFFFVDRKGQKKLLCDWAYPTSTLLFERQDRWTSSLTRITSKTVKLETPGIPNSYYVVEADLGGEKGS